MMRLFLALLALAALGAASSRVEAEEEARSGRFSTPGKQRCNWELRWTGGTSELRLRCRGPEGEAAQSCAYRGEPRRCPDYGARSRQFWRQVLGRLRRRPLPCAPGPPLRGRFCGPRRAPPEAQLRLLTATSLGPSSPAATAEPSVGPVETYCAERWHSLCSFFVGFWEG